MSQPLVTEKKCLVWCCDNWSSYKNVQCGSVPKNKKGGLGDRIRGMITVKIWARILNLDFYIIWDGDQFKDYFDFSDFNMLNIEKDDIGVYTYLHKRHHALNKVFICEKPENIFSNKINKILSNSFDWKNIFNNQYIDKNLLESNLDLEEYSILYTKTLVPTLKMKNLVLNIFKNHTHIPVINRLSEQLQNGVEKAFILPSKINSEGDKEFVSSVIPNLTMTMDQLRNRLREKMNKYNTINNKVAINNKNKPNRILHPLPSSNVVRETASDEKFGREYSDEGNWVHPIVDRLPEKLLDDVEKASDTSSKRRELIENRYWVHPMVNRLPEKLPDGVEEASGTSSKRREPIENRYRVHPLLDRLTNQPHVGACIVGVQIRTGDKHINSNFKGDNLYNENSILNILNNIKIHLDINNIREYSIFLTSDFPDIYTCGKKIWPSEKIIYYDKKICHIDKSNDSNNIDKTYVDNFILSQHTEVIYGSLSSGFTKIAGLSSNHSNFYDISDFDTDKDNLHQITKINKKQLLRFKCSRGRQKKNISNAELKLILKEDNKI